MPVISEVGGWQAFLLVMVKLSRNIRNHQNSPSDGWLEMVK